MYTKQFTGNDRDTLLRLSQVVTYMKRCMRRSYTLTAMPMHPEPIGDWMDNLYSVSREAMGNMLDFIDSNITMERKTCLKSRSLDSSKETK